MVRADPFHRTVEFGTKFVPCTARATPVPPPLATAGLIEVRVGVGLLTANERLLLMRPPGLRTATGTDRPWARSAAAIWAERRVLETNDVVRSLPSQVTTAPLAKSVPLTVRVNGPPPAVALEGDIEVARRP